MQKRDRLRIWTEQGNVTISQLFFSHYKAINIRDEEAILLLHLIAYGEAGNHFPTPQNLVERTHFSENKVVTILQRLMQKGLLQLEQHQDQNGIHYEYYSFYQLWELLVDYMEQQQNDVKSIIVKKKKGIYINYSSKNLVDYYPQWNVKQ